MKSNCVSRKTDNNINYDYQCICQITLYNELYNYECMTKMIFLVHLLQLSVTSFREYQYNNGR